MTMIAFCRAVQIICGVLAVAVVAYVWWVSGRID